VDVANPHQGGNVRLVWLGGERIPEEENGNNLPLSHSPADNQVAARRAVGNAFHWQIEFLNNKPAGAASGHEFTGSKDIAMFANKLQERRFKLIVGDERNHLTKLPST
jgi:hypothetical protein